MKFVPHAYQAQAIDFIIDNPKCGLFLDMGLGKTVSTLTALDLLMHDYFEPINKILVIAPARVVEDTWPTEVKKWDHLKNLKLTAVIGTPKERLAKLEEGSHIFAVSRDLVTWLVDLYGPKWPFDVVVIDELSSFKNSTSKRFRALKKVTPFMRRVIGLTGTPAPNSYLDLWPELYLLDRGERLFKRVTEFRANYFTAFSFGNFTKYSLRPGAKEEIDGKIKDICISMKAKDYLSLEEPTTILHPVTLSKKEMAAYKTMERDYVLSFDDETVTAMSAAALTNKLLQLSNGAVYTEDQASTVHIHDKKLDALEEIVEAAQGGNILVFYNYRFDLDRIKKRFKQARALETSKDIADWNAGKIPILLAHPQGCGHGLNLQQGGAVIVWFGLTWSLEYYLQANARLARQGQTEAVRIYHLIAQGTVDERAMAVLEGKDLRQEELLKSLKAEVKR